jgi:anti-sigma B factor antagonist
MALDLTCTHTDKQTTINVIGEVDVSNADLMRGALDEAFGSNAEVVRVDLSSASYIDSTGIGVLVGAAHRAGEAGVAFEVANPQRNVERVLALLGVDDKLGIK